MRGEEEQVSTKTKNSLFSPPFLLSLSVPPSPLPLAAYLWSTGATRYIEAYVQKVNPSAAPAVVGGLLDADAPDEFVTNLILSVRSLVPVDALCEEVERRNRLRLLTPFLEQLVAEGSKDAGVHSALGKILVDSGGAAAGGGGASASASSSAAGTNAEHFLTTNPYYDSRAVGKYCEKRDPHLACVAYRRGQCDDELVRCTTAHSLFKAQARYVVERADAELWAKVLAEDAEETRRPLVDQVVSTALPECRNPEQVSVAVKAFMAAGLQSELIELLEKIVLMANSAFANNHNLQNLLIITAIKADKSRVADYISRLDNFDGPAVGEIAVGYEMFDEAFEIYKKFGLKAQAVKVLLEHGKAKGGGEGGDGGESPSASSSLTPAVASPSSLAKADAYAAEVDDPAVWTELGHAHLAAGDAAAAIAAYTKAGDGSRLSDVVAAATAAKAHAPLIEYLLMARAKAAAGGAPGSLKGDPAAIDSELVRKSFLSPPIFWGF